ncbi:MAG: hypothetical protein WC263_01085, partial [Candidatus Micrarchaeia archaeon]
MANVRMITAVFVSILLFCGVISASGAYWLDTRGTTRTAATTASNNTTKAGSVDAAIAAVAATVTSAIPWQMPNSNNSTEAASGRRTAATAATATASSTPMAATGCVDEDGGFNVYKFGKISGTYNETGEEFGVAGKLGDGCSGDGKVVTEMYCGQDGYIHQADYTCLMGYACKDGACTATGGATCVSEGDSCSSAVCCYPLACKKFGSQYLCANSTISSTASSISNEPVITSGQQSGVAAVNLSKEAYGTIQLDDMLWFAYGMDMDAMPYYVEMSLQPTKPSGGWGSGMWSVPALTEVSGIIDGISLMSADLGYF